MKFFRLAYVRKSLTIFTGVVFLNLSFFLAEIKALELDKRNQQLIENLVRVFSNISEEEKDVFGGESHDSGSSSIKEVDLYVLDHGKSGSGSFITILKKYQDTHNRLPKSRASETPSQPPEA